MRRIQGIMPTLVVGSIHNFLWIKTVVPENIWGIFPYKNIKFGALEWPFGSFLLNIWPCSGLFGLYGLEKKKDGTMNLYNT